MYQSVRLVAKPWDQRLAYGGSCQYVREMCHLYDCTSFMLLRKLRKVQWLVITCRDPYGKGFEHFSKI